MSISLEYALANKEQPAVLCCRAEAGITITEHNLEDPAIFDDLIETGLLDVTGALTIGQVLNAKLTGTYDSLTPLTAEKVEGINEGGTEAEEEAAPEAAPAAEVAVGGSVQGAEVKVCGGVVVLNIAEGKGIHIELPI